MTRIWRAIAREAELKPKTLFFQLRNLGLSGYGPRVDHLIDFSLPGLPGGAEIVFELEAEPEFGRGPKVSRQAQGGVGGDSSPAAHDII